MKAIRALASAALAGLVLVALAIPAAAATGDSELYRQATCGDLFRGGSKNPDAFCDVQAGFKPGSNGGVDKNWLRVTVKYSIWVNGVKKTDGEIKIDKQYSKKDGDVWNATPKSHTWFTRFKPCDEIEIRWAEAPIIGEDPTTLKEVEIGKFRARQDKYRIPGDCSVSADGLSVSVMLPTDTQDATDNGLLASNSTTEPNPLSGGGGALPV